ncbi:hypothetical protein BT96DRAFT_496299 [Gymnopus androsaceus JB14]|uniref:F-box domain-containing protein n=1 Tax=Gymnopus androsaceus JB14 TaxID=1447944 RepID=A0A6A4GMY6_9AGAR|nr:hypothetical protein BT96DRAFT_496299 [Gymnopus androsaceus JB14]
MFKHRIAHYTSTLCAVCVAWRKAAHLDTRLWSKLCLSLERYQTPVIPELGWVKEWINVCPWTCISTSTLYPVFLRLYPTNSWRPFWSSATKSDCLILRGIYHSSFLFSVYLTHPFLNWKRCISKSHPFPLVLGIPWIWTWPTIRSLSKSRHSLEHPNYNVLNSLKKTLSNPILNQFQ